MRIAHRRCCGHVRRVVATASVIHLSGAPAVEGYIFGESAGAQLWNPVPRFFVCLGAFVTAFTTLSGKARQVRPSMVATVIPAAFLLPSAAFFAFNPDDAAMAW